MNGKIGTVPSLTDSVTAQADTMADESPEVKNEAVKNKSGEKRKCLSPRVSTDREVSEDPVRGPRSTTDKFIDMLETTS